MWGRIQPVGFVLLGQKPLGEIEPLFQLSQAMLHCVECLTQLASLVIRGG